MALKGYRNAVVEADVAKELDVDAATAAEVFQRMLAFLDGYWLHRDLSSPTAEVDCAWHAFIVHTRAYRDYCDARFGAFLHHDPEAGEGRGDLARCGAVLDGGDLANLAAGVKPLVAQP